MKEKLSVIIPAYNEELNIRRIPGELMPTMEKIGNYEIVIVDDGSKDNTLKVAKKLKGKIRVVKHPRNMGLGAAMKTGLKNSTGDLIIFLDADLTFHPREIPKLLKKYYSGNYDCVIGTQFGKGSKTRMKFHRKLISKTVNVLYTAALGRNVTSMSAIFRVYKRSALRGISMTSNNFDINAEILFDMIKKGKNVAEVPVTLTARKYGKSKISFTKETKNHIKILSKIVKWRFLGEN